MVAILENTSLASQKYWPICVEFSKKKAESDHTDGGMSQISKIQDGGRICTGTLRTQTLQSIASGGVLSSQPSGRYSS